MAQSPCKWWVAAPDLTFINDTIWNSFLRMFIPQWYYTDDDLVPMVHMDKVSGKEAIQSVKLRNGDEIVFRAYTQSLLSKMGASVKGGVYLDEPPPNLQMLTELVVRVIDGDDAIFNMSFTPVNVEEDIIDYIENHTGLSQHRWGMMDNPVFRDNAPKRERALAELSHLSEMQRNMRLNGDWVYEIPSGDLLFENAVPEEVDDFPIPLNWRQVRMLDPAGHRSGFAIFAEDPNTGEWFCTTACHIEWKQRTVKATDIEAKCDEFAPHPEYRYFASIYDNAENWFAAHANNTLGIWTPCITKKVELSISLTRAAIANRTVKFFRDGAALLVREILRARRHEKTGAPMFKKLHALDCLRYFCMMIPERDETWVGDHRTEEQRLIDASDAKEREDWKRIEAEENRKISVGHQRRRR
jgi:hypothetical protein